MSSETRDFPGLPPFPRDVPKAPLLRLSFKKLLARDEAEIHRLIDAAEDLGFFYLDLENAGSCSTILDDADQLFKISKEFFNLSLDEKKKFDFSAQNSYFGYKEQGAVVIDKEGTRDRNESYNVLLQRPRFHQARSNTDELLCGIGAQNRHAWNDRSPPPPRAVSRGL